MCPGAKQQHQSLAFPSGAILALSSHIKHQYTSAETDQFTFYEGGTRGGIEECLPDIAGHWQHPETQGPWN